jgi:hypothetical protein
LKADGGGDIKEEAFPTAFKQILKAGKIRTADFGQKSKFWKKEND